MKIYTITSKDKIDAFANRKSSVALKIIVFIFVALLIGVLIKFEENSNIMLPIIIFSFVGLLFFILFSGLKKLMWGLGKHLTYTINDQGLLITQNIDSNTKLGFIARYLYWNGKRKGAYCDVFISFEKMKSIQKKSNKDLILKTSSILIGKVIIPREIENLRELQKELKFKIN